MHGWLGSRKAKNIFKPGKQRAHYQPGLIFLTKIGAKNKHSTPLQYSWNVSAEKHIWKTNSVMFYGVIVQWEDL